MTSDQKSYTLDEFKRRHALSLLRKSLQEIMPDKYKTLWWCKDEALTEIRRQFVLSTNHCVIDEFLGTEAFSKVREEIKVAHESNLVTTDGMLTFQGKNESIRTDKLGWFDCTALPSTNGSVQASCAFDQQSNSNASQSWPHMQYLMQRIETIVSELGSLSNDINFQLHNSEEYSRNVIIGNDFKSCHTRSRIMVTCYGGKSDTKHLDNGNKNGRRITAIYYVNQGWRRPDGGALRLYTRYTGDEENKEVYCDVEPLADRLVLFLSDQRTPHEVLPSHTDRFAVTLWFWDRHEKAAADLRDAAKGEVERES